MKTTFEKQEIILKKLWKNFGSGLERSEKKALSNETMVDEFFFIVLGGYGISYEQNISGLEVLKKKQLLNIDLYKEISNIESTKEQLKMELSIKQFKPITSSGHYRKYRFIDSKALTCAKAGYWLWNECRWDILGKLEQMNEGIAREWLCNCSGIGLKSASWYLRNTGFNNNYAVFDVHILRFLNKIGLDIPRNLTEKSYIDLEERVRNICKKIGVSLGDMDYLLWLLGRNGYLKYVG